MIRFAWVLSNWRAPGNCVLRGFRCTSYRSSGYRFCSYFPVQLEADFGLTPGLLKENGGARLELEQASASGKQAARSHVLKQSLLFSASSSSRLSMTSLHNSNITVANAGPSQLCFLFRPSSVHRQCLTQDRQWVTGSH